MADTGVALAVAAGRRKVAARSSADYGKVEKRADGCAYVVVERRLPYSVDDVWRAIAEPAQRAVWVPGIRFDPVFDIWFGDQCDGPAHVSGRLGDFDPPRTLRLGSIRFELAADGADDSECRLTFTDVLWYGGKRTKTEFANAVLGGWHQFLDRRAIWLAEGRAELRLAEPDSAEIDVAGRE